MVWTIAATPLTMTQLACPAAHEAATGNFKAVLTGKMAVPVATQAIPVASMSLAARAMTREVIQASRRVPADSKMMELVRQQMHFIR